MIVIEGKALKKSFLGKEVLKGIDFQIQKGEFVALLGPNGAGKTTLLSMISGLRRPTSGSLKVFGEDPWAEESRQGRGVTPQDLEFPHQLKVNELLNMVQGLYRKPVALNELIGRLGFSHLLQKRCGSLSGGERRIVALALALLGNPELIVLDEPTTGLDVEVRETLWKVLREEKAKGKTVLLTSHDLSEVEILSERVLLLSQGQLVFSGGIEEILAQVPRQRVEFESSWTGQILGHEVNLSHNMKKTLITSQSDQVVKEIVESRIEFKHLRIESAGLEEAIRKFRRDQ